MEKGMDKKARNRFLMNKKGQEISITTIILIVLGLVVLVVLIIGFTVGWSKIKDWIVPSNNVKQIADLCAIACGTDNSYGYCFEKRELKVKEETLTDTSCYALNKKRPIYGVDACVSIDCEIYDDSVKAKEACSVPDSKTAETKVWYLADAPQVKVIESMCKDLK